MSPNRIEAMRQLAHNLRSEGQTSRADVMIELLHEIRRLQDLLGLDYEIDSEEGPIRAILVKEEAELNRCMCSRYCGDTSPAIIDADVYANSIEGLIEVASAQLPTHQEGKDAPAQLFIVGRDLSEGLRSAHALRIKAVEEKRKEEEKVRAQAALEGAIKRAEARVAELATGTLLEAARADLRALQEKRGW